MKSKDDILLEQAYGSILEEAKKKVNPWAVCNASTGGKKKNPKKFEKCVKGVKKKTGYVEENEKFGTFYDTSKNEYVKTGPKMPESKPVFKDEIYAKKGGYVDVKDLAEFVKDRISKNLPQDSDIREDLINIFKKLSAKQLGES